MHFGTHSLLKMLNEPVLDWEYSDRLGGIGQHYWCRYPAFLRRQVIRSFSWYWQYQITYPFPNFNGCTVEVWEWISNFIPTIYNGCNNLSIGICNKLMQKAYFRVTTYSLIGYQKYTIFLMFLWIKNRHWLLTFLPHNRNTMLTN